LPQTSPNSTTGRICDKGCLRAVKAEELTGSGPNAESFLRSALWVWAAPSCSGPLVVWPVSAVTYRRSSRFLQADALAEVFSRRAPRAAMERQAIASSTPAPLACHRAAPSASMKLPCDAEKGNCGLDAHLTWISARHARVLPVKHNPAPWIARLQTWDLPDTPVHLHARGRAPFFEKGTSGVCMGQAAILCNCGAPSPLTRTSSVPCRKAYACPEILTTNVRPTRFELDRAPSSQQGWEFSGLVIDVRRGSAAHSKLFATRI